ncbi:hypothetical protein QQ045_019931 [Rhodiola kirilowii]
MRTVKPQSFPNFRPSQFSSHPVDQSTPYSKCGLNGVVYNTKGFLPVAQSNTGKLFRVDAEDGIARTVSLPNDLPLADGVVVRKDGVVLVVSPNNTWFLTSHDSWMMGGIKDEITLDTDRFPTSMTNCIRASSQHSSPCICNVIVHHSSSEYVNISHLSLRFSRKRANDTLRN